MCHALACPRLDPTDIAWQVKVDQRDMQGPIVRENRSRKSFSVTQA